jgi:hypothetical protein
MEVHAVAPVQENKRSSEKKGLPRSKGIHDRCTASPNG